MSEFNYDCDGQMDIFDFLNNSQPKVIGYCHATNDPCNRENLTQIAHYLGFDCTAECCASCSNRKECGAACNYSHNY